MDTFESLTNYYNTKDEHLRLSTRHGSVEFLTTVRYVEKYLSENHRILEIYEIPFSCMRKRRYGRCYQPYA
jgi:hypothetical protein